MVTTLGTVSGYFVLLGEGCQKRFTVRRENAETSLFKRCYGQACAVTALIDI